MLVRSAQQVASRRAGQVEATALCVQDKGVRVLWVSSGHAGAADYIG